ncbi:hypothetical protein ACFX58_09025 [Sphingomonas sp. NCPPB 2930]
MNQSLREALPSPPRRAASPEGYGPSSSQWEGLSGYGGAGGWSGWPADGHGALTGGYPEAPVDAWSALVGYSYPDFGAHQAYLRDASLVAQAQVHAREWAGISSRTLTTDGDERIDDAVRNLSLVFASSPTFRRIMATIEAEGPVRIRVDPQCATAYFNSQEREVVMGDIMARAPSLALGVLAFELSNASLTSAFRECSRDAANTGMSAREFAESFERVEYNSIRNVQDCYLEAYAALQQAGLDRPSMWHCVSTADGRIGRGIQSEDEAVAHTQRTGHFGRYEQEYARGTS